MYRPKDLQFLQDLFNRSSNDIAVLYGSRYNGLAEIIGEFIKDKECLYYRACAVSEKTQKELFAGELRDQTRSPILPNDDYEKLILSYIGDQTEHKKLIVFDDFQYLIKGNPTFLNFIASLLSDKCRPGSVMYLLVSDNVKWIEKDMIRLIGRKSSEISGIVKLNDYTATEFRDCFPQMPISELIALYSVIGGKSSLYDMITEKTTMREFIIDRIEEVAKRHFDESEFLPRDIREPQLYNTILLYMAGGDGKLSEIHNATGLDRAKLSVYIKILAENDIVEKAESAAVGDPANTLKASYLIKEPIVRFYYRFIFPHVSSLSVMGAERFYRRFIEHDIFSFLEESYPLFCMEHIRWLEREGRLNFRMASIEKYYDKNGAIDFVIVAAGGNVIACKCRYAAPHMSYKAYEDAKAAVRRNKIPCDNIWLFSASGFDQKLAMFGSVTPGVKLIDGADQRLH